MFSFMVIHVENQQYLSLLASEAQALLEDLVPEERAIDAEIKQCRVLRSKKYPNMNHERRQEHYRNLQVFRASLRRDFELFFEKLQMLFALEKQFPTEGENSNLRERIRSYREQYGPDIICSDRNIRAVS